MKEPTNRQLLAAVVALSLLSTLLCIGVLFQQRGHRYEVQRLERQLEELDRELFDLTLSVDDP